jgi:CMP-N-acetylneuraminic acid synthetase
MKIVALLTARGKSGLANKNILPVLGKPLLTYPARAALGSRYIKSFYVSSDDAKILKIAGALGFKKIKRPQALARPSSRHIEAIWHALRSMQKIDGLIPDILVVLLANSAVIKTGWIDSCVEEILRNREISAVVPVYADSDHHPYRAKKIARSGLLEPFFNFKGREISTNRQDLPANYFLCHNFWVLNTAKSVFLNKGQPPWAFMGGKIKPFIVSEYVDVHREKDIKASEEWLKENR